MIMQIMILSPFLHRWILKKGRWSEFRSLCLQPFCIFVYVFLYFFVYSPSFLYIFYFFSIHMNFIKSKIQSEFQCHFVCIPIHIILSLPISDNIGKIINSNDFVWSNIIYKSNQCSFLYTCVANVVQFDKFKYCAI